MNNKFKITFYTPCTGNETYFTDEIRWLTGPYERLTFKNEDGKEILLKGIVKVEEQ
jgi:hypothetical protein